MEKQITLNIKGMSCNHCVMSVKNALSSEQGVKNVQVDLESKQAHFQVNENIDVNKLIAVIQEIGYSASLR